MSSPLATQFINTVPTNLPPQYEFIDSKTLAKRWCLPESWVREQVRSRSADPLPHVRFGKYVRFRWGSPELNQWAERRLIGSNSKKTGRDRGKVVIQ